MGSTDASVVAIVLGNESIGPLPTRLFGIAAEKSLDADVADSSELGSEICVGVDSVQDRLRKSATLTPVTSRPMPSWCRAVAVQVFGIPPESIPQEMIPNPSSTSGDPNG